MTHQLLFPPSARGVIVAAMGIALILMGTAAHADKGGIPNAHAGTAAQGAASANGHAAGGSSLILGITPVSAAATSYLQFTNAGTQAGTATVIIYAADTGVQIATWTSPSIPPLGSLLEDVASIASGATPALTAAQAAAPVDLGVQSTIHGNVQTLMLVDGALTNISDCGPVRHGVIGGVPGPGSASVSASVRIGNDGSETGHATLKLYSSIDGTQLGTWTSADVPAHGSTTVSTTAIAAAASPLIPAATTSFTVASDPAGLDALVLVNPTAGGAPTLLNNACRLKGSGVAADDEDTDD